MIEPAGAVFSTAADPPLYPRLTGRALRKRKRSVCAQANRSVDKSTVTASNLLEDLALKIPSGNGQRPAASEKRWQILNRGGGQG